MAVLVGQRSFALVWSANLASSSAGWALGLVLSLHVYDRTGSATATSALLIAATAPAALLGSLAGVVGDRVDRRRLLAVTSTCRVAVVAALAVADHPERLWVVYAVAVVDACARQLFVPAEQALVADLVPARLLPRATAANSAGTNATRLAAPAAGGALLGLAGFTATVSVVVALLAVAAVLVLLLPPTGRPAHRAPGAAARATVGADWRDGLRQLRRNRSLRAVAVLHALDAAREGALSSLFPVLLVGVIGASATQTGVVNSSFAVTALLAAPLVAPTVRRFGYRVTISAGTAASALALLPVVTHPGVGTALAGFLLAGAPYTLSWVAAGTLLLVAAPPGQRARAVGATGSIHSAVLLVSAAVAGPAADLVGAVPVLVVALGVQLFASLVFALTCPATPAASPHEDRAAGAAAA